LIEGSPDKEVICRRPGPNLIGCEMTVERSSPGRMKWGYVTSEEASTIAISSVMMLINQIKKFFLKLEMFITIFLQNSGNDSTAFRQGMDIFIDQMIICYVAKTYSLTHFPSTSIYAYCRGRFPRLGGLSPWPCEAVTVITFTGNDSNCH
jgi:hypothetical protein